MITSPTAQVFAYDAYGNPHGFTLADALTTHLYSGEQTDQLTGLQYLRARYYNPATGGLNRLDPFAGNLSDPQSLHKYLYTHGDPVNGVDPSGQILELLLAGGQYAKLQAQRAMAGLSALRGAYGLQRLVGIYQTAVASYAQVGFRVAGFLVKAGPTIRRLTTLSGVVFVSSTVRLACEEFGFVPRTGYTECVVAVSSTIFSGGMALSEVSNKLRGTIRPLQGSRNGKLLSGRQANREIIRRNANYANSAPNHKYDFAAQGKIAPGTKLVRVYNPNDPFYPSQRQRAWVMPRSEIAGLSPEQIARKFRLPNVPTHITDVRADGIDALVGQAANNFGYYGGVGGTQIYFLNYGATFNNGRLLLPGGI